MTPTKARSILVAGLLLAGCSSSTPPDGGGGDLQSCTGGDALVVGCNAGCGVGSCTGDPILRVCDGTVSTDECQEFPATHPLVLGERDDTTECGGDGRCPTVRVTCPLSGSIRVVHRAFGTGAYTCEWTAVPEGSLVDAGPGDAGTPDSGAGRPPTTLPVDCREPAMRSLPECDTIGSGDSSELIGGVQFGYFDSGRNAWFVNGSYAIMRVDAATGARSVLSGPIDDPRTGPRTVGAGPVWTIDDSSGLGLIAVRQRADGQMIAMSTDGFYTVDPASGDRTFLRDFTGAPPENAVRGEGRFAIGPAGEFYVVLARGTSGSGVGVARFDPGGGASVVTLSGAVDGSRNRGAGVSYDVAGYAAIEYANGALYMLNFDDDSLMHVDPTTGDRTIVSDASRGVGVDTDEYGHAVGSTGSLLVEPTEAFSGSTRIDLASGDRRFASPYFRDIIETRHMWDAIYRLNGIGIRFDPARRLVYEAFGFGIRVSEIETGNYNYITSE